MLEPDGDSLMLPDIAAEVVCVGVELRVRVKDCDGEPVPLRVAVGDAVRNCEADCERVSDELGEPEGLDVPLALGVPVELAVGEPVGVCVRVGVCVADRVWDRVSERVCVADRDWDGVGTADSVTLGV